MHLVLTLGEWDPKSRNLSRRRMYGPIQRRVKAEGKKFATAEFARGEIISGPPSPLLRPCSVDMDWRDRVGGRSDGGHHQRNYFAW